MKYRCPYCRQIVEAGPKWRCPACRKTALLPDFHVKTRRKKGPTLRQRQHQFSSQWAGALAKSLAGSSPLAMVLVVGVLLVGGALLLQQTGQTPAMDFRYGRDQARTDILTLRVALLCFQDDCRRFPATQEGLTALVRDPGAPGWHGPYIMELKPDPWRRSFVYRSQQEEMQLLSLGADGIEGTADDISLAALGHGWNQTVQKAYTVDLKSGLIGVAHTSSP